MRRGFAAAVLTLVAVSIAGCGGSATQAQSLSPTTPTSTAGRTTVPSTPSTSPAPSQTDPKSTDGKAAATAYSAFAAAARNAERRPTDLARRKALAAHAIEPALTSEAGSLVSYAANDIAWSGTAPTPRISVIAVAPSAEPYPTVTVRDCPTPAPSWKPYNIKTHKVIPVTFPGSTAPPPHAVTATVVYYRAHWMVQRTVTQVKKTCAPS